MKTHVLFVLENNCVFRDRRVLSEAAAARDFGYEVSVVCPSDGRANVAEAMHRLHGIRVYLYRRPIEGRSVPGLIFEYANALFWEFILSLWIYCSHPFQLIHSANPPDHTFLVALLYKPFGVKYIFDHHDIAPENYVAKFGRRDFFYRTLLFLERMTFRVADVVISTNNSYRQIAENRGAKDPTDIFVVRNGPAISELPEVKSDASYRQSFRHLVGYVGIIGKQDGIENLLQAARYIVREKNREDIGFVVVGTGTEWSRMTKLAKELGVESNVRFTGYVPDEELYRILSTVDVCVNPEYRNEFTDKCTMIKIMEYMAFGKPIVQFHTTEGKRSAEDSAVCVRENSCIAFAEELLHLLEDEGKRKRMGLAGRRRVVKELCWEKQKSGLAKAYTRALSRCRAVCAEKTAGINGI